MKRRRVNIRFFFGGVLLLFLFTIGFIEAALPLERFFLDSARIFLLGTGTALGEVDPAALQKTNGSILIIGKRSNEFHDVLIVNASLEEGTPVRSGNVLVGFVVGRGDRTSKVQLIASPQSSFDALFERLSIPAHFSGRGAGVLETRLPRGSGVEVGDAVVVQDEYQLIVGVVAVIEDTPSDPFQTIFVHSPVNITTLGAVETAL